MPEKESTSDTPKTANKIDLNALADLSFGPSWADGKNAENNSSKPFPKDPKSGNKPSRNIKKDRRGQSDFRNNKTRSSFTKHKGRSDNSIPEFIPRFDIKIYPQDETFEMLIKQLKSNFKTYQLFEITRLILEKSDRFVCLINRTKEDSDESLNPIYFTPKDNLPFETEEEAINHFCEHYLENYFDIETIEVEPPKGSFSLVYRCPFTKYLIGPPNYHRFNELLKSHYSAKIKNISLEDYQNKLESLSEESSINEWLESTKKQLLYRLKNEASDNENNSTFKTLEEARRYLVANHKEKVVKQSTNFRFSGAKLNDLPKSNLRQTILQAIEAQRRFPLETANNIRGRLRRHKFTIYKKGSKGISYVCCVKRKFRDDTTVFTESINELIHFIEKNQNISIQNLPYTFLSIPKPAVDKNTHSDNSEAPEDDPSQKEAHSHTKDDANQITEVIRNLRWLITEGYVTEYSDGKIFVHPVTEVSNLGKDKQKADSTENKIISPKVADSDLDAEAKEETELEVESPTTADDSSNLVDADSVEKAPISEIEKIDS